MKNISNKTIIPKRSLGQNFLIDPHVQDKIISCCDLHKDDVVLEIGPGKGAITSKIAPLVKKVIAVEKDRRLAEFLKEQPYGNVEVICEDFLDFSLAKVPGNTKIIGNLPYNVATPIIEKVLQNRRSFTGFFIMLQLEHGRRLCARPDSKDYGSLSCFVQLYTEPKLLFRIKNTAFSPRPKVESCFLRLDLLPGTKYPVKSEAFLSTVTKTAFSQRRKTILNALERMMEKEELIGILRSVGVDPKLRPENIPLEKFAGLSNCLFERQNP